MEVPGASARIAAIVDLMLTVAYIDGQFHSRERSFVHQYLDSVIRVAEQSSGANAADRARLREVYQAEFLALFTRLDGEIAKLGAEVMATTDGSYVATRLKGRAVATFRAMSHTEQALALELIQSIMHADRVITPAEQLIYDELRGYFSVPTAPTIPPPSADVARPMVVGPTWHNPLKALGHPLLDPLEQTYSPHPQELQAQVALDWRLVEQALNAWNRMRAQGNGRLAGVTDVGQLPLGSRFLDGFVHVMRPDRPVELVVLGDLHGCYGCLKAALMQSDFINRAWAHQWDPVTYPDVKLVLLGDYIDRGRFSFDGVMRAVLQLFVTMPDHVVVLRGNHEYFLTVDGRTTSGVHPAEALASITPHVPPEMLEAYRVLFENMPTSFVCERTLFVHGGIPRDDSFAARYRDLSSLNDLELRFQMMWGDPSETDVVPVELQRQNARFSFGRQQFRGFMERTGLHTMVRGHEQIERGFDTVYDLGDRLLLNLFSAGGHDNCDLPRDAAYRSVTPMALTIQHGPGAPPHATPWRIDYQPFNYDVHNGLHRVQPLLEFRYT